MKKLLLKIILLVFLVTLLNALGFPFLKYKDDAYEMAAIDKRKLLQNIQSPRIIFIGGSNLAFGLDSKAVEEATGMHVVNMGLHVELGLKYHLSEIKPYIGKGDIVVIVPEYEQFFGNTFDGGPATVSNFINFSEDRKYLLPFKQYLSLIRNYPVALGSNLARLLTPPSNTSAYSRKSFNEYGDNIGHLNKNRPVLLKIQDVEITGEINKDAVFELNSFKSYAKKKGSWVFLIYPCLIDKQYKRNEKKINLLCDILQERLEITVLSTPRDYVLPEPYFYDTAYHLNNEGRKIRTQKIVSDLKRALLSSEQGTKKNLFLGDSITKYGDWESLFKVTGIVNCGISGDTTIGVLRRIDKIIAQKPDKIFLMIGINDYLALKSESVILKNYKFILERLQKSLPETEIYVQSILPVNSQLLTTSARNKGIEELNKDLKQLCEQSRMEYINLFTSFMKNGQLNEKYTNDGVHLNSVGYELWRDLIKKYVAAENGNNRFLE